MFCYLDVIRIDRMFLFLPLHVIICCSAALLSRNGPELKKDDQGEKDGNGSLNTEKKEENCHDLLVTTISWQLAQLWIQVGNKIQVR